jgi:hypothetical protein
MSNPTGDALVAIGITDTQKMSKGSIKDALRANRRELVLNALSPFIAERDVTLAPAAASDTAVLRTLKNS